MEKYTQHIQQSSATMEKNLQASEQAEDVIYL